MFESFGSIAMRPMCSEFLRPTLRQVLPPSSDLYRPLPYDTLRWLLFSPVPTQTVKGFFGSSAMQPIEYEPSRSNTGVHVVPLLTVFQTPPEALATKWCEGLFGSTANPITRPEVNAGPIDRKRKPLNVGVDMGSRGRPSSSPVPGWRLGCGDACGAAGVGDGSGCDKAIEATVGIRKTASVRVRRLRGNIRFSSSRFAVVRYR